MAIEVAIDVAAATVVRSTGSSPALLRLLLLRCDFYCSIVPLFSPPGTHHHLPSPRHQPLGHMHQHTSTVHNYGQH
uniref:Uncharacterized protein n=1 Tax=Oryza nivara TaxID=4536 RepID=A0A0E0IBJ5_ORYNI